MKLRNALTVFVVAGLVVGVGGCGQQSAERDRNVDGGLTCAQGGPCEIGDIGPGGGIVFSTQANGGANLEAAPVNGVAAWGCGNSRVTTSGGLGDGAADSTVVAACDQSDSVTAAELAESFSYAGSTDWYLPSVAELKLLYANRSALD